MHRAHMTLTKEDGLHLWEMHGWRHRHRDEGLGIDKKSRSPGVLLLTLSNMNSALVVPYFLWPVAEIQGDGRTIFPIFCRHESIICRSSDSLWPPPSLPKQHCKISTKRCTSLSPRKLQYKWFMQPYNKRGGEEKGCQRSKTGKGKIYVYRKGAHGSLRSKCCFSLEYQAKRLSLCLACKSFKAGRRWKTSIIDTSTLRTLSTLRCKLEGADQSYWYSH